MSGWLALLACLLAGPALAQDRPLLTPSRDVDVIYSIAGPEGPLEQRLRWGTAAGKLRVDPPTPGLFMVLDTHSHRMETVREQDHTVLQVDAAATSLPGMPAAVEFIRRGTAHIAGLDCTQWATIDNSGRPTLVCITEDGVLLRAAADGRVLAIATEVRYAAQADAVFRVPEDYRRIVAPPVKR
jgi:hypothetical protein